MDGDGLVAETHFDGHLVVQDQQAQLFAEIAGKQVGPGQRGLIGAGPLHKAVGQLGVCLCHGCGLDAHKRGVGVYGRGRGLARHEALHGSSQVINLLAVQLLHMG